MKKHILSKKCWCKPDVISFRKENEDKLSNKIFEIATLFNDSMDNSKYNKIRKILKSLQMETEVTVGLKNFQVTMKELADARREVIEEIENKLESIQFVYEHQWTDEAVEKLCERCGEVIKIGTPCEASIHITCWKLLESVLATLRKEES